MLAQVERTQRYGIRGGPDKSHRRIGKCPLHNLALKLREYSDEIDLYSKTWDDINDKLYDEGTLVCAQRLQSN